MKNKKDKHLFSIYFENFSDLILNLKVDQDFVCKNKILYKRLFHILRLKCDEHFILFDKNINTELVLLEKSFEKENIIFAKILKINKNKPLSPQIIFCPSMLKKSSFENIVYTASSIGVSQINPIETEKVKRRFGDIKENNRLSKIIISACEQSKNFFIPQLNTSMELSNFLKIVQNKNIKKVVFDTNGMPLFDLLKNLHEKLIKKLVLMFGPEGGFTDQELELLKNHSFEFYKLTPTTLRSVEAISVGLGSVRSMWQ
ncbi:RsmE family RNA methyltransferase [Candidatus Babeliales bacterium]|nr:RsmE family RNA methyltransferase [Candidatus Babeliales bacterium]